MRETHGSNIKLSRDSSPWEMYCFPLSGKALKILDFKYIIDQIR